MRFWYRFILHVVFPFYFIAHPFRVKGLENIPEGRVVIASNHSDLADPVALCLALGMKNQVRPMAKKELRRLPVIGCLLEAAGAIFVDRGNADLKAMKTAFKHLKDGGRLMLFPEGTRVREGEESQAKGGAALMATRTDSPLVPVYISENKPWFRFSHVVIGTPYYPQFAGRRPTAVELETITEDLMARIRALREGL